MKVDYILFASSVFAAACPYGHTRRSIEPANGQSAKIQIDHVWNKVLQTPNSGNFPIFGSVRIVSPTTDVTHAVTHQSDEMPRKTTKLIHSVGVIAKVKFEATPGSPYTGVFQGSDNVIARLSTAAEPKGNSITPGVAFKFFRDGAPTANFVAMFSLRGQPDNYNFFANVFSNHIRTTDDIGKFQLLFNNFQKASNWVGKVGLSDLASINNDGTKVVNPVFPFQLIFKPQVSTSMVNNGVDVLDQMAAIPKGSVLWTVWAASSPTGVFKEIGAIRLTTNLVRSKYADETMFFRHQKFEEDLNVRPEWIKTCPTLDTCGTCHDSNRFEDNTCKFD